jgi:hypothetical protein
MGLVGVCKEAHNCKVPGEGAKLIEVMADDP